MAGFQLKRVHEQVAATDGRRILVERLWPRGISKERATLDDWRKDLAPSSDLRRWFGHRPERWPEFRAAYRRELAAQAEQLADLRRQARTHTVTLLYAARDHEHNSARVLKEALEDGLPEN
ncbi:MAG TPA: DUF488 family protein [Gammaproteobacteria bacterium]|nr:DUF488 family protein [Gammaproteobacteria bacterium]